MADNRLATSGRNAGNALAVIVKKLDAGALVGVRRNERFASGGRTNKFNCNAWVCYRPTLNREEIERDSQ
jgi:hypothetical protein